MAAETDTVLSDTEVGEDPTLAAGPLSMEVSEGRLRVFWAGTEVVRQIDCPIRDADWRTLAVAATHAEVRRGGGAFGYRRGFRTLDGSFAGVLAVEARADAGGGTLEAALELTSARDVVVNRAGFVVLHPIPRSRGRPSGCTMRAGDEEATGFPRWIAPAQPATDIAGLDHAAGAVDVGVRIEGEVFEMEDQRNWTDASFKTYCRPLGRPRPYRLAAGEAVRQRLDLTLTPRARAEAAVAAAAATPARMPRIRWRTTLPRAGAGAGGGRAARAWTASCSGSIGGRRRSRRPRGGASADLEIVTGADAAAEIAAVAAGCRAAGISPRRVVALPAAISEPPAGGAVAGGAGPTDLVPRCGAALSGRPDRCGDAHELHRIQPPPAGPGSSTSRPSR